MHAVDSKKSQHHTGTTAISAHHGYSTQVDPNARPHVPSTAHVGHSISRISVGSVPVQLQAKPLISEPGDPAEREADAVADRVMHMPYSDSQVRGTGLGYISSAPFAHIPVHTIQESTPVIARQVAPPSAGGGGSFPATVFIPGDMHDHSPTGKWSDVQSASSCFRGFAECACAHYSPADVIRLARDHELSGYPLAQSHLDRYTGGGGADLSVSLEDVVRRDVGVRGRLAHSMRSASRGHVRIEQGHYDVEDFRLAFGAIDRLDYEVDASAGLVHVWFQDRYEFHPVGFGYTRLPGDIVRPTNCVHAAAVELKSSGAADYWMVGDAVVPSSLFAGPMTYSWGKSERDEGEL